MRDFIAFPKIPRLYRDCTITEKIDGTNASVFVPDDGGPILAGSRNRWLSQESDNYGFAKWVAEHEEELRLLGPGHHFGEWWGAGIQRRYGMSEKRFSLFRAPKDGILPGCCYVVPTIFSGRFSDATIEDALCRLREQGSIAAPGWRTPEGIVVYHSASGQVYKVTLEHDEEAKGARR